MARRTTLTLQQYDFLYDIRLDSMISTLFVESSTTILDTKQSFWRQWHFSFFMAFLSILDTRYAWIRPRSLHQHSFPDRNNFTVFTTKSFRDLSSSILRLHLHIPHSQYIDLLVGFRNSLFYTPPTPISLGILLPDQVRGRHTR